MQPIDLALLVGAGVALVAIAAARLGSRVGLPALLLFLLLGVALGSSGIGIDFSDADLAHGLGFGALVVILAEGGLTTRWRTIRPVIGLASLLATLGIFVSVGLMALFAHFVLHLAWPVGVLLGAVTAPTDSAAVFSVLRNVSLPERLRATLEAESGLNDAPTVLLVVAATGLAMGHQPHGGYAGLAGLMAVELVGGVVSGLAVGCIGVWVMRRIKLSSSGLSAIAVLAWCVAAYGLGVLEHVSGFAAVYVCAVLLGNANLPHRYTVRSFVEGVGWMAQIGLFVMLGLLATPARLTWSTMSEGVLAGLFLTFVARPMAVLSCASWFKIPMREQAFLSWAGLRGAVPIILATIPMAERMSRADKLFDVVLVFVVVFTCIQGPTLPWVGRKLGLVDPAGATDVDIEAAPLDRLHADLLQIRIPVGSHLAGVTVRELRLPNNTVVSLVIRETVPFAPHAASVLREGDELMVVTPNSARSATEARFTEIGRGGRLARWRGVRAEDEAEPAPPKVRRRSRHEGRFEL